MKFELTIYVFYSLPSMNIYWNKNCLNIFSNSVLYEYHDAVSVADCGAGSTLAQTPIVAEFITIVNILNLVEHVNMRF